MKPLSFKFPATLAGSLWAALLPLAAETSPYQGLWVGEVVLGGVNEVTVPLDANNVPRAPDPNVVTPTADAATLRLILHVDSTGKTSLLKNVAILARKAGEQEKESDLALVTDERLYGAFPPQPATRISSVVFDFGDAKATAAVNRVADLAATAAANEAVKSNATLANVKTKAQEAAAPVVAQADAAAAFTSFLQTKLDKAKVIGIANGASTATTLADAIALRDGSFFKDTRGVDMLAAIQAAVAALPPGATQAQKEKAALNTAAAYAETDLGYERFLAGELFGDAISAAAEKAASTVATIALKPVTAFQSGTGGTSVTVVSDAHGLVSGDEIAIQGAAAGLYNGLHAVVRLDDNSFRLAVPFVAGGAVQGYSPSNAVAPLVVKSPGHGLTTGTRVILRGSLAGYNGEHLVTVIDGSTFSIDIPFASDPAERGVWSTRQGEITGYEGTADGTAGVKITAPDHGLDNGQRIEIMGAGTASYNGLKIITRIDANSFSIPQAFAGNPAEKGTWDVPVAISQFQPPTSVPTLITAPNHLLKEGDRVIISGSGKAEYNGEFDVTVVNANAFSIPVPFDAATGDPGVKGQWAPASGGMWRKTAAIRAALNDVAKVTEARTKALAAKITAYDDSRAPDALELVLNSIVASTALSDSPLAVQVTLQAEEAGRNALDTDVVRYPRPATVPSTDYSGFVRSSGFAASVNSAAEAAAAAAMKEKANLVATPTSIRDKALAAAINALTPVFSSASRALLTELPMGGSFGPSGSGLSAEIVLPANHPTNPFRHRRHPDHTVGFDIRRLVNLSFAPQDAQPGRSGYGVDRIAGNYDEEIFGLHKPLGPSRDIGLKVRGSFQLQRISHIDTLNGR
jgi:hypothetical protein